MKTSQFSFELPEELIAQEPAVQRDGARLMVLDRVTGKTTDSSVHDLASWIEAGTVVVLNDTRVRKARVFAESPGGAGPSSCFLPDAIPPSGRHSQAVRKG